MNTYIRRIYEKLHVRSRSQAVAKFIQVPDNIGGKLRGRALIAPHRCRLVIRRGSPQAWRNFIGGINTKAVFVMNSHDMTAMPFSYKVNFTNLELTHNSQN